MSKAPTVLLLSLVLSSGAAQSAEQGPKVADTIEQRMLACAICHGEQGEGIRKSEYYPRLAGKPAGYIYNQLINFRERRREIPIMTYMVAWLSEPYLREIAEYYANLHPPYPRTQSKASKEVLARGEQLVRKGEPSRNIPACDSCHGKALTGVEPAIPGLIGLVPGYIIAQMGAWKTGHRRADAPDCMANIALHLSLDDISAAAEYLNSQPPTPADARPAPADSVKLPMECGSVR
jgi:cytochrome c553